VTFDRIVHADREPQNWLSYGGELSGWRHSPLTQLTAENVNGLNLAWVWRAPEPSAAPKATPLVVDGVLYAVMPPNQVVAIGAAGNRVLWTFNYVPKAFRAEFRANRGLAILGSTLFMGTLDAHLLAIDAYSGTLIWDAAVADAADPSCGTKNCYSIDLAPLVVKDKVIVGTAGGEGKVRGFIAAFDSATGKEAWRFHTIPGPDEPGHDTWTSDSWKTGGGSVWNTGTYDAELNLTYWGIGNPVDGAQGTDLLYTESVVALDADTGALKWHYQFTPHDTVDWDATQVPVLVDLDWQGQPRKLMLFANRNGIFYVLDRATGEFLSGKPFAEVNWMSGFDEKGRPLHNTLPGLDVTRESSSQGTLKPCVGQEAATNWYPPSYNPTTSLLYVAAGECRPSPAYMAIRALDPRTGERKWEFKRDNAFLNAFVLTTASGLVVVGDGERRGGSIAGQVYVLDAATGHQLWQTGVPGRVNTGPITYMVNGKQYLLIEAGQALFAFALR
jgi:alcohol dehydrogenase (cytochrome c)